MALMTYVFVAMIVVPVWILAKANGEVFNKKAWTEAKNMNREEALGILIGIVIERDDRPPRVLY